MWQQTARGYEIAPFAEQVIVNSGRQSMPLAYGNTNAQYSETTRTFAGPQNWSNYGIKGLTLRFAGIRTTPPSRCMSKSTTPRSPTREIPQT